MKRIHMMQKDGDIDLNKEYSKRDHSFKPEGLWYSCGDEWKEWCIENEFGSYKKAFEIDIDESKIYTVHSCEDLDILQGDSEGSRHSFAEVIDGYAGIEFPYALSLAYRCEFFNRENYSLLRSLDVDSGCIWDLSAIKGFKEIPGYIDYEISKDDKE